MDRELAREHFKACNLSYSDINMSDIWKLIRLINEHISTSSCEILIMINEPKNKDFVFNKNGSGLKYGFIKVKGTYFDAREAISFNEDGYIGFCGWASGRNTQPFVYAFKEWCDYLKDKKVVK